MSWFGMSLPPSGAEGDQLTSRRTGSGRGSGSEGAVRAASRAGSALCGEHADARPRTVPVVAAPQLKRYSIRSCRVAAAHA